LLLAAEAGRESHGTRAGSRDPCSAQVADDRGREEYQPLADLLTGTGRAIVIADKGF
jgi:hypothetical protein